MPVLVTAAWLVLSLRTFVELSVCVLWSLTSGCMALTFTLGKEPDAIIYPPTLPPLSPLPLSPLIIPPESET